MPGGHFHLISDENIPGWLALSVTCLTAERCLSADPGVASLIPALSHTFAEIDNEIISTTNFLPSAYSRRVVVSYQRVFAQSTG